MRRTASIAARLILESIRQPVERLENELWARVVLKKSPSAAVSDLFFSVSQLQFPSTPRGIFSCSVKSMVDEKSALPDGWVPSSALPQQHDGQPVPISADNATVDGAFDDGFDERVTRLARQISHLSTYSDHAVAPKDGLNPFLDSSSDPRLDPFSDSFSASFFVDTLLDIGRRDPAAYPIRTAGVCFRNLSAYGFGTGSDYQMTVVNAVLKIGSTILNSLHKGNRQRIDILRNFDGVLNPGEMLMVLGRPGSYVLYHEMFNSQIFFLFLFFSFPNVVIIFQWLFHLSENNLG